MICGPIDLTWLIDLGALRRTHRSRGKPFSALDLMAGAVKGLLTLWERQARGSGLSPRQPVR